LELTDNKDLYKYQFRPYQQKEAVSKVVIAGKVKQSGRIHQLILKQDCVGRPSLAMTINDF